MLSCSFTTWAAYGRIGVFDIESGNTIPTSETTDSRSKGKGLEAYLHGLHPLKDSNNDLRTRETGPSGKGTEVNPKRPGPTSEKGVKSPDSIDTHTIASLKDLTPLKIASEGLSLAFPNGRPAGSIKDGIVYYDPKQANIGKEGVRAVYVKDGDRVVPFVVRLESMRSARPADTMERSRVDVKPRSLIDSHTAADLVNMQKMRAPKGIGGKGMVLGSPKSGEGQWVSEKEFYYDPKQAAIEEPDLRAVYVVNNGKVEAFVTSANSLKAAQESHPEAPSWQPGGSYRHFSITNGTAIEVIKRDDGRTTTIGTPESSSDEKGYGPVKMRPVWVNVPANFSVSSLQNLMKNSPTDLVQVFWGDVEERDGPEKGIRINNFEQGYTSIAEFGTMVLRAPAYNATGDLLGKASQVPRREDGSPIPALR